MRVVLLSLVIFGLIAVAFAQLPYIWELTDGDDKGIGGGFDIVDDFRQPPWIFKFTYAQQKNISVGNKRYLVPDNLGGGSIHKSIHKNVTQLMDSWSDYFKYTFSSFEINAAAKMGDVQLQGSFKASKGYINHLLKTGNNSFAYNGAIWLTFGLNFRGSRRPPLDPDFAYDVAHLPAAYNYAAYAKFIKSWGTHYFINARYGCEYNITVSASKKWEQQRTAKWATQEMDLTIKYKENNQLGIKHNKEVNKSAIDGKFLDGSAVEANSKGGDETKFQVGKDFDGWLASCATLKVPIVKYSEVEPLTEVITNPTIKNNLKQAIIQYAAGKKKK